jgi:hypothetical protein
MKWLLLFLLVNVQTLVFSQYGDAYSTRNPNASQDWIMSQQRYSQSMIDSYRSTTSGIGFSVNSGSANYMWNQNAIDNKAKEEARKIFCEKSPDICAFQRKRDSASSVENALIKKRFADANYASALKCKQEKNEQKLLEKAGYKSSEITYFIDNNYAPNTLNKNITAYNTAIKTYEYTKKNIKTASFENLIYNLYYFTNNGFHHTAYEFLDEVVKRFPEKKQEIEIFNIYLCMRFFEIPLVIRYDTGLFAMIRSWEIYYRERAIWEFYQFSLKYPYLAHYQYANYIKTNNDTAILPLDNLYFSLQNDSGTLRGYKRYIEDMTKRKLLASEIYKTSQNIVIQYQENNNKN